MANAIGDFSLVLANEGNTILSVMVQDLLLQGEGPNFELGTRNIVEREKIAETLDTLTQFVHQAVGNTTIKFSPVVVESEISESLPSIPRTAQERLSYLKQDNPAIDLLIKSFDLKLDYD